MGVAACAVQIALPGNAGDHKGWHMESAFLPIPTDVGSPFLPQEGFQQEQRHRGIVERCSKGIPKQLQDLVVEPLSVSRFHHQPDFLSE
jgi:hypothetical protein